MTNYEIHITVKPDVPLISFADWCFAVKGKPIFISVPKAKQNFQPMLSLQVQCKGDEEAMFRAKQMAFFADTWGVTRIKLESELLSGPAQYFELHLTIPNDFVLPFINRYLISRNVFEPKTYLTRRGGAPVEMDEAHGAVGYHSERVIWDSNSSLDDGWA